MASPVVSFGTDSSTSSSTTVASNAISYSANTLILAHFSLDVSSGSYTVGSVTGGSLTWHQYKTSTIASPPFEGEVWYAITTGALTNTQFTATATGSGSVGSFQCQIVAVTGYYAASPFDPNASLPAISSASTPAVTVSTNNPDDLLVCFYGVNSNTAYNQYPTGFTQISTRTAQSTNCVSSSYKSLSSTLSSSTVTWGSSGGTRKNMMLVAVTADAPITGSGPFLLASMYERPNPIFNGGIGGLRCQSNFKVSRAAMRRKKLAA